MRIDKNVYAVFQIDPDPPAHPSEDVDVEKEKSLVEILLRKYGFGRWTLPPDDSSTEAAVSSKCCKVLDNNGHKLNFQEGSTFSRTALEL